MEEHLASSEEQLVEEELQLVRSLQAQAAQPTKINMNVKTNSIYFDQLLLTHLQEATTQASHNSPLQLNHRTSASLPSTTTVTTTSITAS